MPIVFGVVIREIPGGVEPMTASASEHDNTGSRSLMMNIHSCARCDGSGHVTGGYGWEIPWTRWAGGTTENADDRGLLRAHVCPDCCGTGALLEFPRVQVVPLPWGGIRQPGAAYSDHVALVLQSQSLRHSAN
jgi:hypothetical protein